ncbi:hypothetical protein AB0N61_03455 [Microbacterium sp. NPDC089320]|uniref:hypothetical protein n=1 Tax=Microbacterium sp. NPDC089320 TaxID=3155182 RepID=UPI0034366F8E
MSTIVIEDEPDDDAPRRDLAEMYASLSNVAAFNRASLELILNAVNETVRLQNSGWLKQLAAIDFQPAIPKEQLAALSSTIAAAAIPVVTVPEFPALQKLAQQLSASITAAHSATYADMAAKLTASLPMPDLSGIQALFKSLDTEKWREWLRSAHRPSNWTDEIEGRIDEIIAMIDSDGIPVAWVPRGEILQALLDAPSADERSLLLIAHRDEILEDCQHTLARVEEEPSIPTLPLAQKVLLGATDGHWELAALSAVAVVHGIVEALRWASAQQNVAAHHALKPTVGREHLVEQATRAPLIRFYDDWNEKSGKPRPTHVTRHVVSHKLAPDQVSERNCVVAIMLMCSLLRTVYELELGSA